MNCQDRGHDLDRRESGKSTLEVLRDGRGDYFVCTECGSKNYESDLIRSN